MEGARAIATKQRKIRVIKELETSTEALRTLRRLFKGLPEGTSGSWVSRIDNALYRTPNRIKIGIVGATGSGKSTLVNSLLGEPLLTPTSSMRACTAAATEVSWNDREGAPYRATITPISCAEWRAKLEGLLGIAKGATEQSDEANADANVAWLELEAVYPELDPQSLDALDVDMLMDSSGVAMFLQSGKELEAETAGGLHKKIQQFIGSNQTRSGEAMQYWPLIQKVCIYTKAPILATGCVLVDLPGIADKNTARASVARKYLQHCDAVWIVAPIIRAANDSSGSELLGEGIRRQLHRDGTINRLTFVCSKTDEIDLVEILPVLKQDPDFARVFTSMDEERRQVIEKRTTISKDLVIREERLVQIATEDKDLASEQKVYKALKKRQGRGETVYPPKEQGPRSKRVRVDQTPDTSEPSLSSREIQEKLDKLEDLRDELEGESDNFQKERADLRQAKRDAEKQLKGLRERKWVTCVNERNRISTHDIQRDFIRGIRNFNGSARQKVDDANSGDDGPGGVAAESALPVFCVSARGYKKLIGGMKEQRIAAYFPRLEDTGIPTLCDHACLLAEDKMLAADEAFVDEAKRLLTSIRLWCSGSGANHMSSTGMFGDQAGYRALVKTFIEGLFQITHQSLSIIQNEIMAEIQNMLPHAGQCGMQKAVPMSEKWTCHYRTFQAIMRRDGVFQNPQRVFNFNAELSEPFLQQLDRNWARTFNQTIPRTTDVAVSKFNISVSTFSNDFTTVFLGGSHVHDKKLFQDQLARFIRSLDRGLQNAVEGIGSWQRETNRMPERTIQSRMHEAYQASAQEHGVGMLDRMRGRLTAFLRHYKSKMFEDVRTSMDDDLNEMVKEFKKDVLEQMTLTCELFRRDCENLISHSGVNFSDGDPKIWQDILQVIDKAEATFEALLTPHAHNTVVQHSLNPAAGSGPSLELVLANPAKQTHSQATEEVNGDKMESEDESEGQSGSESLDASVSD